MRTTDFIMDIAHTTPERNSELEEQIRKLNAIGISLSNEQNLSKLLEVIVREARHFTRADGGSLYIREGDRLNFTVAQTESLEMRDGGGEPFKAFYLPLTKESIAGYVALTGEVLNIQDVYEIPSTVQYRINKQFDIQNRYRSKSMLVVPMSDHSGSVIGVLQLINSLNGDGSVEPFRPEYESLVNSLASQAAVAIRNVTLIEEIKRLFRSLVRYSAKAIDARSPHTAGHSGRVAAYCVRIAAAINDETAGRLADVLFSAEEVEELRMAAWLHDIGKIGVRESVLEKSSKLSADQIEIVCQRFEGIKRGLRGQFLEQALAQMASGDLNVSAAMQQVDSAGSEGMAEIDDMLACIKRANIPGVLPKSDVDRLRSIAALDFVDSCGRRQPYLTANELENLSITKGNLTQAEYLEIQSHVTQTLDILKKIPFTKDLENIPRHAAAHHEYLDGSGYPRGLKGDEITLQSRIMCIADIFDALNSPDRPYKKALPLERTLSILRAEADAGKLDKDIVELFIRRSLFKTRVVDEEDGDLVAGS